MGGLPDEALDVLIERMARICLDPYDRMLSMTVFDSRPTGRMAELGDADFADFRIWTCPGPGRTGEPGSVRSGVPRHSEVLAGRARRPSRVNWRVRRQPSSPAGRSRTR
jgi:hypothetical protein